MTPSLTLSAAESLSLEPEQRRAFGRWSRKAREEYEFGTEPIPEPEISETKERTMNNDDDQPAFPVTYQHDEATAEHHGMTLRDYMAAKAFPVLMRHYIQFVTDGKVQEEDAPKLIAEDSYSFADAMMEARKPKSERP